MIAQLTYEQHASRARAHVRALGLHDCIHYAPDWQRRVDALYAEAETLGYEHWKGNGGPGLLADGRMAYVWKDAGIAEPRG